MSEKLVDVTETLWGMEFSVHDCPKKHKDNVAAIFPGLNLDDILIIPTCQRSDMDLVNIGHKVETEKDRLLERFMAFAKTVCEFVQEAGHWADYIDPCSGLPMIHRETGCVYGEVEGLSTLLNYQTQNAGCCKILLHPKWGSAVYPASLFAKAPLDVLLEAIRKTEEKLKDDPEVQ